MIRQRPDAIRRRSSRVTKGRSRGWEWSRVRVVSTFISVVLAHSEVSGDFLRGAEIVVELSSDFSLDSR
jgi:hypothetical protein